MVGLNASEDKDLLEGLINWYADDIDEYGLGHILNRRLEDSGDEAVQNFVLYKAALAIGERLFNKPENEAAMFLAVAIIASNDGQFNFDNEAVQVNDNKIILNRIDANMDQYKVEITVHTNPYKVDVYSYLEAFGTGYDGYDSLLGAVPDFMDELGVGYLDTYIIRTAEDTIKEVLK